MSDKFIGEVIKFSAARLSFPVLDVAEAFEDGGSKSFSSAFLLDPKVAQHEAAYAKVESEVERAIAETWPAGVPAKLKVEFHGLGDDRTNAQTGETYKGYEGMLWVSAKCREDSRPLLKNKRKVDLYDPRDEPTDEQKKLINKMFFAGVYVNATVNVYVGPLKYGPRICCGLRGIMSLERGEAFGGGARDSEFDDFDADDGDAGDVGAPEDDGLGDDIPF